MQQTLAIIKPNCTSNSKSAVIIKMILLEGFAIRTANIHPLSRDQAEEFYAEHVGKEFYGRLIDFMTSDLSWLLILEHPNAVKKWRALMGPTDPEVAMEKSPGSFRALYGDNVTRNAVHGSDSLESAEREIALFHKWFPGPT